MNKPLVSVIMPTYNRAHYLGDSVVSVLKQTYGNFELLIIDDGSSDKTKNVVKYFVNKDPRVQYIFIQHTGCPAGPRNFGLERAQGDYLTFLDSDDEYLPEKLERQVTELQKGKLDVVGVGGVMVDAAGDEIKEVIAYPPKDWLKKILVGNFIFNPVMMTRAAYEKIGGFDECAKFVEDWEWLIRAAEHLKIGLIEEALFKYRVHGHNLTTSLDYKNKAATYAYVLGKHQALYAFYPRAHTQALLESFSYYMLAGDVLMAREQLQLAKRLSPTAAGVWAHWLASYAGAGVYREMVGALKRLRGEYF